MGRHFSGPAPKSNVRAPDEGAQLAECLWWVFVLGDRLGVDVPAAYESTMDKIGGDLGRARGPTVGWPGCAERRSPCKAATNMLTLKYAEALPRFRVNIADPGPTATEINDYLGTQTVTEGTDAIIELATAAPDGPTGTYRDRDGVVPW